MPLDVDGTLKDKVNTPEVKNFHDLDLKAVMDDLLTASELEANSPVLVTCRLNKKRETNIAPIWCGWLESAPTPASSPQLKDLLGGAHVSDIYQKCLNTPGQVHKPPPPPPGLFGHDQKLGYTWRRYICIMQPGNPPNKIGTLTVGFKENPKNQGKVEGRLRHWAQGPGEFHKKARNRFNPSAI
jgi:hypothetical protein